jgi:predicted nucleic acid-binding protein
MRRVIIADTSCFIILSKINELELLHQVYGEILTTVDIVSEFGENLPYWVEIVEVKDKMRQQLLEMQLDKGESSAMALALEMPDSTLIVDDYKARKVADHLRICYTGTIGVIIKAKLIGKIDSIKPLIKKIKETNFRISSELEEKALLESGEL